MIINRGTGRLGLIALVGVLVAAPAWSQQEGPSAGEGPGGPTAIVVGDGWHQDGWEGVLPVFTNQGAPWTFTGNYCLTVTDVQNNGDIFRIYDNGEPIGETSNVDTMPVLDIGLDPDEGLANPEYSSGVFPVGPGSHSITIEVIEFYPTGFVYLRVDECPLGTGESIARFPVEKFFNDGNTEEVEVTISCNTGLPLEQSDLISQGDGVTFVVTDFNDAELDCEITETAGADGYLVNYQADGAVNSPESCVFEDIRFMDEHTCRIDNTLDQVEVVVTKDWIDENPQFEAQNVADATWSCSNVALGSDSGFLDFFGDPDEDSFFVFPDWETGTNCSITEVDLLESGIEVDDSDCQGLLLFPGEGASCTIVNTRLFEGIPTLSQYGLGLLALLMLGVGFVAYRRIV